MPNRTRLTDVKPSRTEATVRFYVKGGFLLLVRAQKKMAGPGDVIDAFRALFSDPDLVYRPATTRQYKQQVRAVIASKLHAGELEHDRAVSGFADLTALLKARRGPCPKRTSRAKLKTPTQAEYRQILQDFDRRTQLAGLDKTDGVLSLMIALGPYVGLRPVEWLRATIRGNNLVVVNAKSTNGRSVGETRSIVLDGLPNGAALLIAQLIARMRLLFDELGANWRQLLGRLGERLASICSRLGIPRWCLYTTRHAATANWKKAGFSPAEIAALAGHISTRTARDHYAGSRHGWTAKFACARPDPDLAASISLHNDATPTAPDGSEANEPDAMDAPAVVKHPLVVGLIQKSTNGPPTEDETKLASIGDDTPDEAPVFTMR